MISWIIYYIKNNIILMILSLHSFHLIQSLNIEVFNSFKRLMISAIESFVSIKLYYILKIEWLFIYIKTYDNIFSIWNIQSVFVNTNILSFNISKVINRVKSPTSIPQDSMITRTSRESTLIDLITSFKTSILTSSLIYNENIYSANIALLTEFTIYDTLSILTRIYKHYIVRKEKCSIVRNIITEEKYEKLKIVITKRKTILNDKRQIMNEKHILTTSKMHDDLIEWEKMRWKGRSLGLKGMKDGKVRMSRSLLMSLKLVRMRGCLY